MKCLPVTLQLTILGIVYLVLIEPKLLGYFGTHVLRAALLLWILLVLSRAFASNVPTSPKLSDRSKNTLLSVYGVVALLLLLESIFVFVPRSHGVGYTYAAQNWFAYFWRTNEHGYRDEDIHAVDTDKPIIAVVGDSFAAGHGIRDPKDTFSGKLEQWIGNSFEVINLGQNGVETRREYRNLIDLPVRPSIVVLQYFGNDIELAAKEAGLVFEGMEPYSGLSRPMRLLLQGSYLLNYLYWMFPNADGASYIEFLDRSYRDPSAMEIHATDLRRFVQYSRECALPLLVVLFPRLRDTAGSEVFTAPVLEFFDAQNVPVIDVSLLVANIPLRERVVNVQDGHPSTLVHELVAQAIQAKMAELGLLDRVAVRQGSGSLCD